MSHFCEIPLCIQLKRVFKVFSHIFLSFHFHIKNKVSVCVSVLDVFFFSFVHSQSSNSIDKQFRSNNVFVLHCEIPLHRVRPPVLYSFALRLV